MPRNVVLLIVDDHPGMHRLIQEQCARPGDRVIESKDRADVLATSSRHHPALVVMDIMMPRMDGIQTSARITEGEPGARITTIAPQHDSPAFPEAARNIGARHAFTLGNFLRIRAPIAPFGEDILES